MKLLAIISTYLKVAEIGSCGVEKADRRELDGRVQTHVLEATEARHKCGTALAKDTCYGDTLLRGWWHHLPDNLGNATDVEDA